MVKFGVIFKVFKLIKFIILIGIIWVDIDINWLIVNISDIVLVRFFERFKELLGLDVEELVKKFFRGDKEKWYLKLL